MKDIISSLTNFKHKTYTVKYHIFIEKQDLGQGAARPVHVWSGHQPGEVLSYLGDHNSVFKIIDCESGREPERVHLDKKETL